MVPLYRKTQSEKFSTQWIKRAGTIKCFINITYCQSLNALTQNYISKNRIFISVKYNVKEKEVRHVKIRTKCLENI